MSQISASVSARLECIRVRLLTLRKRSPELLKGGLPASNPQSGTSACWSGAWSKSGVISCQPRHSPSQSPPPCSTQILVASRSLDNPRIVSRPSNTTSRYNCGLTYRGGHPTIGVSTRAAARARAGSLPAQSWPGWRMYRRKVWLVVWTAWTVAVGLKLGLSL